VFNWLRGKRYVVTTIMVGLNGRVAAPLLATLNRATQTIVEYDGEFEVASAELSRIAGALVDYETSWSHSANWGEVFKKEEEAGDYGADCFAQNSQRYLSSGDGPVTETAPVQVKAPQNIVVMLTVAYEGEIQDLEASLTSTESLKRALSAIVALHNRDQLQVAHLHYAPAHFGDDLDDDQLLVNYPELVAL